MAEADGISLPAPVDMTSPLGTGLGHRVLSTVVLLPVLLAIVMFGPMWLFGATIVAIAAAAQWEFTGMFQRAGIATRRILGSIGGVVVTASFVLPVLEQAPLTIVLLVVLAGMLWRPRGTPIAWEPIAVTVLGICYINWLLGYGVWLRDLPSGRQWILLLIWVTWLGETAAYLVGSSVGRHSLAPMISPKKTVEGAVAQLLFSVLAAVTARVWFFGALAFADAVMVGLLLGVVGQAGDLVESSLKRSVGTKDTSQLIPGHGGMLDRIDSLLFNTPVLFYYAAHGRILGS